MKAFIKHNIMLLASLIAALVSFAITAPSLSMLKSIEWRTLGNLAMMLCVLSGFKDINIFSPIIETVGRIKKTTPLAFFLVFSVFFSSMFVTNDVSLLVFVPLSIMIFKNAKKEEYILPLIVLENIAAIRGSMLTPFGSPQNLFMFEKFGISAKTFMLHMLPLSLFSALFLSLFILIIFRKEKNKIINITAEETENKAKCKNKKIAYSILFIIVVFCIVSRTKLWYFFLLAVVIATFIIDKKILLKVDYVLLATFLCFFIFSTSITGNKDISNFLSRLTKNNEYWCTILLSQIISNVPATIVLYPFTLNRAGLIYGADTAGLVSIIGSLASVINLRIYSSYYPSQTRNFLKTFSIISLSFFAIMVLPGYFLSKLWAFG